MTYAIQGTYKGEKAMYVSTRIDIDLKRRVAATVERDRVFGTFSSEKHADRVIAHISKMQAGADQDWSELTIQTVED